MFQLTIQIGNQASLFLFKDKEKAEAACKVACGLAEVNSHPMVQHGAHSCEINDEFGRYGKFYAVQGVVFEDLDQSQYANIALAIHQQHVQLKYTEIARKDPALMQAARGGPAVIQPFGMNGGGMRQ